MPGKTKLKSLLMMFVSMQRGVVSELQSGWEEGLRQDTMNGTGVEHKKKRSLNTVLYFGSGYQLLEAQDGYTIQIRGLLGDASAEILESHCSSRS